MNKVYKGSAFKQWFLNNPDVRRVLTPTWNSFYLMKSLDEINDDEYYSVEHRDYTEVVIKKIELIRE
ncbi:hypothetical protein [Bacillus atrophaeus]|uniref:hypothetical protein n=1 Tax=Bacillus atrophaeus TaxID=1452 RepID=UPI002E1FB1E5|nr:hypothetical protein [Bacillus atrophaeus]